MRQERGRAAGRRRRRPRLLRRARPAARSRRPARHPLARRRQPHSLGAPRLSAAQHQHRPLARQPGGAPLRRADGAGGALPARPRPQVRRVRAPRRRLAHGLRQPRERPRRHPPHADPAGVALRPPRDQGRPFGLVRMGSRERDRARDSFLHPAQARASSPSSIPSRARQRSPVPVPGSSSQTS